MKDLISIIVPVYNKAAYLQPCLDSLQAQIYTDIEVILVDDGSTDASGSICQAMCRSDARFHYLRQENAGQNAARKAGLDIARGTWIIFVDADDTVTDDMCSSMMQRQQETQADMVCSGYADVPWRQSGAVVRPCMGALPRGGPRRPCAGRNQDSGV